MSIYPEIDRTEVLYGVDNVINAVLGLLSKANRRIDSCMDRTRPSLAIEIPRVKGAIVDSKSRGIRMRLVTEITDDNVSHCKELIRIIDELRHLEGIKGTFLLKRKRVPCSRNVT
jgi:two-component system, OmpR family, sensor histidine kinase VicK